MVIEAWAAGECAGESCGPARRPQSRGAAVCAVDEAALSEAAGGPASCRIAAQPSALLGPMSTTVPHGPAAAPTSRYRGWQTLAADNEMGRRLFPSSLRGSSLSRGIGWYWRTPAGLQRRPPRRATKTRIALRRAAQPSPKEPRERSFVPDTCVLVILHHIAAAQERRGQITIAAAR